MLSSTLLTLSVKYTHSTILCFKHQAMELMRYQWGDSVGWNANPARVNSVSCNTETFETLLKLQPDHHVNSISETIFRFDWFIF